MKCFFPRVLRQVRQGFHCKGHDRVLGRPNVRFKGTGGKWECAKTRDRGDLVDRTQ